MLCKNFVLILGLGKLVTTEYRVLPSIWYSAEPSSRTEYRFSPSNNRHSYYMDVALAANRMQRT